MLSAILAAALAATIINPDALKTEADVRGALGDPCVIVRKSPQSNKVLWYMAVRCDGVWCKARCESPPPEPWPLERSFGFMVDRGGQVVKVHPPAEWRRKR